MIVNPSDTVFLASLLPGDPSWGGTGALPLYPDSRDYEMARIPEVKAMLEAGAPASYDLIAYIKGVYNQGQVPSCVAASTCGMKSLEDYLEHSLWNVYDEPALYKANGGTGQNGVDTRRVLQYAQDTGLLVLQGTARYRIGSYAFAPRVVGQFEDTIKAAISANRPCVLALLLPQNFGWDSSGGITQNYHQIGVVGYSETHVTVLNSWGAGWGKQGLGRVPWSFITQQNFQNGYVYAYTVIDALDSDLKPPVNQPPVAHAGGPYTGVVGQLIALDGSGSRDLDGSVVSYVWEAADSTLYGAKPGSVFFNAPGTYTVTLTVTDDKGATATATTTATISDKPVPSPIGLKVTGYRTDASIPAATSLKPFEILGEFGNGVLQVFWIGTALRLLTRSATLLTVEAPYVFSPAIGPVKVQIEGESALGPLLAVLPNTAPPPPPVGELKVTATIVRLGTSYAAYATVADPTGASIAGTILKCMVGTTTLPDRTIAGANSPAIWTIPSSLLAPGTLVLISATAPDGRKGATNLTFQPRE